MRRLAQPLILAYDLTCVVVFVVRILIEEKLLGRKMAYD